MKTLILNVDRDNDFGEKIGVEGPLIGRQECFRAASKLILQDPEDSDANALFGAIKHYDDLHNEGMDVEIALITGDVEVGRKSDEKLGRDLDILLSYPRIYGDVILVSDGAEDDYITPLITSRTKIRYVKHIIVRHNQNIESLYYYIVKGLKDKKLMSKVLIPVGLVLLAYGISTVAFISYSSFISGLLSVNPNQGAITVVTVVLGAYLVERGFEIGKKIRWAIRSAQQYANDTRITFITYLVTALIILTGLGFTYSSVRTIKDPILDVVLLFFSLMVWWVYAAIFARIMGIVIQSFLGRTGGIARTWSAAFFVFAVALISYGVINYVRYIFSFISFDGALFNIGIIIAGVLLAILASLIHRHFSAAESAGHTPRAPGVADEQVR
ncbi:MAG: DUF373 family protein [Thermoplasmataceae archaeon]